MNGYPIGDLDGVGSRLRLRYESAAVRSSWFVPAGQVSSLFRRRPEWVAGAVCGMF